MEECFKCNTPETKALLFDAVLPEGIVKVCGKCSATENIPIMNDKFLFQKQKNSMIPCLLPAFQRMITPA